MAKKGTKPGGPDGNAPTPAEKKKASNPVAAAPNRSPAPPPVYERAEARHAVKKPKADPNVVAKSFKATDILTAPGKPFVKITNVTKTDRQVLIKAIGIEIKAGKSITVSQILVAKYFKDDCYAVDPD